VIKPWGEFICVTDPPVDPQENRLKSGLYLPEQSMVQALNRGIVMAAGPGVDEPSLTPGAVIWYAHGAAYEVGSRDGEVLKFIKSSQVVCFDTAPNEV
jgi:hypothetical protein